MSRVLTLLLAMTACTGAAPEVHEDRQPLVDEPAEPGTDGEHSEHAVQTTVDYVTAVCAFHAQPSCVTSRAETCNDGLVLADPAVCRDLLETTALTCPGAAEALDEHQAEVDACVAHLATTRCDERPACASDGTPLDATGPCASVTALVRSSCEALVDPE